MTELYTRPSGRYEVVWTPEHESLAKQAMNEVIGETGVELSASDARAVRTRYQELVAASGTTA
jgi:hypothetical protein